MTELHSAAVNPPTSRRRYSAQFKSDAVQACLAPGAVTAHVARELGINHKMLGRWVNRHRRQLTQDKPAFVPWSPSEREPILDQTLSSPAQMHREPIRVSCSHGNQQVRVEWPVSDGPQCAEFLREWLR